MDQVVISIIVTVYNIEKYLSKCLDSIVNQTYSNLEIILVDDGSTDKSSVICDNYAQNDSRFVVVHKENGGQVSARKAGAEIATGEYVLNIDGDDWLDLDYCEKYANLINNNNKPDIIWGFGCYKEYEDRTELFMSFVGNHQELYEIIIGKKDIYHEIYPLCLMCIKLDLYKFVQKTIDNRIIYAEDSTCLIRILAITDNICFVINPGYHYLQRSNSICHLTNWETGIAIRALFEDTVKFVEDHSSSISQYLIRVITLICGRGMLLADVRQLQSKSDFLVPFEGVKKQSRLILYGIGGVGIQYLKYIKETRLYELVAVVDSIKSGQMVCGEHILSLEELKIFEYDFVIVTTIHRAYIKQMVSTLKGAGVKEEKIKTISESVLESILLKNVGNNKKIDDKNVF